MPILLDFAELTRIWQRNQQEKGTPEQQQRARPLALFYPRLQLAAN
jgi:hypothetical protein